MAFSYITSLGRSLYHKVLNWFFPQRNSQVSVERAVAKRIANCRAPAASAFSLSTQFALAQKGLYFSFKLFPLRAIQLQENPFNFIVPSQSCLLAVFGYFSGICRPFPGHYAITRSSSSPLKNVKFSLFQHSRNNYVSSSTLLNAKVNNNNGLAFVAPAPFCSLI
jgi:hypothetical protein